MPPLLEIRTWRDRPVQLALAAAAALALLATGIVFSRYAGFPDEIVLNFPETARTGDRSEILGIPAVAWAMLAGNGVLGLRFAGERRTVAYTVLGGLVFVEALLVAAALTAA